VPNLEDLPGLWRRGFIAWRDGRRDETTKVTWLQAAMVYADLRQPPWPPGCFSARSLQELSMEECLALAEQQGFAGRLEQRGEVFEWVRVIDFQPPQPIRDIGRLSWQQETLVEEGVETEYLEHWHRDPSLPQTPAAALQLRSPEDGRFACLLRAGDRFMFARDRRVPVKGATVSEAIAGAADLRQAQQLLDFEISLGSIEGDRWQILCSSLSFRAGVEFRAGASGETHLYVADITPSGEPVARQWEISAAEGDTSTLLNTKPESF
jgi:hypothetical protein